VQNGKFLVLYVNLGNLTPVAHLKDVTMDFVLYPDDRWQKAKMWPAAVCSVAISSWIPKISQIGLQFAKKSVMEFFKFPAVSQGFNVICLAPRFPRWYDMPSIANMTFVKPCTLFCFPSSFLRCFSTIGLWDRPTTKTTVKFCPGLFAALPQDILIRTN
jgi:hypothetical protein